MASWKIWYHMWGIQRYWLLNPVVRRTVTTGSTVNRWNVPSLRRIVPVALMLLALHAVVIVWGPGTWGEWFLTAAVLLVFVLMLFGPSLVLWIMPLGMALGPGITRERTQLTWDLLRITTLELDDILLGKLTGALWWWRDALRSVQTVAIVGGIGVSAANFVGRWEPATDPTLLAQVTVMSWIILSGVCFVCDRLQQMVLMSVAALAVSASVQSVRRGMIAAVMAAGTVWLAEIGLAVVIILLHPGQQATSWLIPAAGLIALGPTGGYLAELPADLLLLAMVGTLITREAALRGVWTWTRHAAVC